MNERTFTHTELLILDAKEKFDTWMLANAPMTREQELVQWRGFLARWHSDLRALSWQHFEVRGKEAI